MDHEIITVRCGWRSIVIRSLINNWSVLTTVLYKQQPFINKYPILTTDLLSTSDCINNQPSITTFFGPVRSNSWQAKLTSESLSEIWKKWVEFSTKNYCKKAINLVWDEKTWKRTSETTIIIVWRVNKRYMCPKIILQVIDSLSI